MTVYEYFENFARTNRYCAKKAKTQSMSDAFLEDAERWERRAKTLSVEIASKDIKDVEIWKILEQIDRENQEVFS